MLDKHAEEQMSQAADLLDSTQVMSAYDLMCIQNRAEGRAEGVTEGEARGLLHLAEFAFGQVSEKLESLVMGIQGSSLIDDCYDAIKSG